MEQAGIPFEVMVSNADETVTGVPYEQVGVLARRKAEAVRPLVTGSAVIVAADTLVYAENRNGAGRVLGKPANAAEAYDMLQTLQGRRHTVYTGVALIHTDEDKRQCFYEQADVFFRPLSDETIRRYIATGEPMDKAGAYGIQGYGAALVLRVEGDFYTVMGLPVARLCMALEGWGFLF
jgi:septum formation protein